MVLERKDVIETYIGDVFDLDNHVWFRNDNPYAGRLPFFIYLCSPPPRGIRVYKNRDVEMICTMDSLMCFPNNTKLYTEWAWDFHINKIGHSKDNLDELSKKRWRLVDLADYLEEKIELGTKGKLRLEKSLDSYHRCYLRAGVNAVFIAHTDTEGFYDRMKSGGKIQKWGRADFKKFQIANQPLILTPDSIKRAFEKIEEDEKWFPT